ncbi:4-alpha-glucanotransferase [Prevotella sp. 10(H)]|uniref:4-alpha-glucanotransferase n=1 Tax=Prevotella sp. 10(H) TaxID=1158294 RepID=UPI0004A6B4BD|nr:4-alpha-glucanotransferase [Prevotella sp. 10(H)]
MNIRLLIDYHAEWGQTLCVSGSIPSLGDWNEKKAIVMDNLSASKWMLEIEVDNVKEFEYRYLVKYQDEIIDREWGTPHILRIEPDKFFDVQDLWRMTPQQKFLYTSGFSDSFFYHENRAKIKYYKETMLLNVCCPYVKKDQSLVLCGASELLGDWKHQDALHFIPVKYGVWQLALDASKIEMPLEYKLAIYDHASEKIQHWEEGNNRILSPLSVNAEKNVVRVETLNYWYAWLDWKAAGVAIPVFSLRTEGSFGIGEFSDLKKMIDWASLTGQKVIQLLPVNDTTITHTWADSYPYNAISIYALHPMYLGLNAHPLKDQKLNKEYRKEAAELNTLKGVDYDKVLDLKQRYLKDLFDESGRNTLRSKDYQSFYNHNEEWLFPYACFSYLRDKYETADFTKWKTQSKFNKKRLEKFVETDKEAKASIDLLCFTQYLLHKQLVDVKEYAHQHNVILKGDIPIGISRNSVEAWVEPHLFNLDVQTGAPPDGFSFFGQNWRFPTYNWEEMAKDGYHWWIKRFRKMADYFDAYRIDHILGFFRIWEIPMTSVQGLLGYFSPALPLTVDEIRSYGIWFDEARMLTPYIHEHFLGNIFGVYMPEVIEKYLEPAGWQIFKLKDEFNTQAKIKESFAGYEDDKANHIRDGLYSLCNEVLFVRDKREPEKFHPRITAQYSYSFKDLDQGTQNAFNRMYDDFFFRRHSQFWREQAMIKLPPLIKSTDMLVCGEDLGMVPESVPSVMNELQILSLEIERMPKAMNLLFNDLHTLPYMSVCTTSTHDMSPIRLWWEEDRVNIQKYYNQILGRDGIAPEECTADICSQIVSNHLNSPSMLAVLPLQDWLSIDDTLRRPEADEERINIPAVPMHYWRYRMHLTLEELIKATEYNERLKKMIQASGRE